jgi:transposase-like protein
MSNTHKSYDAKLKAKIAIEVLKNDTDILEICKNHNIPKTNAIDWKNKLIEEAPTIFVPLNEKEKIIRNFKNEINTLQTIIGEITIENNFLKKKLKR